MTRKLLFLLLLCSFFSDAAAQNNFSIKVYAGSNARWGKGGYVAIDAKGNCKYLLSDARKGIIDSSSFTIKKAQVSQVQEEINKIKFTKLNKYYNEQSRDGTILSVEVTQGNKKHTVNWVNFHNKESDELLAKLNEVLQASGIKLTY